tara:strand:+ start:1324 stop:1455 length:132 start_codon:yes stop_codon:yes gene_type:complete
MPSNKEVPKNKIAISLENDKINASEKSRKKWHFENEKMAEFSV